MYLRLVPPPGPDLRPSGPQGPTSGTSYPTSGGCLVRPQMRSEKTLTRHPPIRDPHTSDLGVTLSHVTTGSESSHRPYKDSSLVSTSLHTTSSHPDGTRRARPPYTLPRGLYVDPSRRNVGCCVSRGNWGSWSSARSSTSCFRPPHRYPAYR